MTITQGILAFVLAPVLAGACFGAARLLMYVLDLQRELRYAKQDYESIWGAYHASVERYRDQLNHFRHLEQISDQKQGEYITTTPNDIIANVYYHYPQETLVIEFIDHEEGLVISLSEGAYTLR